MSVTPDTQTPTEPLDHAPDAPPQPVRLPLAGAERTRRRPRGPVRHYGSFLLSPSATAAMPLILERNRSQRLRRLAATAGGRAVQRR